MLVIPLGRFRLHFEKESKEEVEKRKKMAQEKILLPVSDKQLEIGIEDIYPPERGLSLSFFFFFLFLCSPHDVSQNRSVLNGCSLVIVKLDYSRPRFPTTAALELRDEPSRLAEERGEVVQAVPG